MEIKYTEEELNSIDKSLLIKMFLNLQNQMETLTVETKALNDKMQKMMEQLVLANNNRFGRKTKKCLIQTRYVLWK
jgi:transposase